MGSGVLPGGGTGGGFLSFVDGQRWGIFSCGTIIYLGARYFFGLHAIWSLNVYIFSLRQGGKCISY